MKIAAKGFSMNGRGELLGTLLAVSEDGEPLGCEHSANSRTSGRRSDSLELW